MAANPTPDADAFDPGRHKVYEVFVDLGSYTTYVVATSREEADELASAHESEDRVGVDSYYHISEVTKPLGEDEEPYGPTQWGRGVLTVNKALEVLADPSTEVPAPPPVVADLASFTDAEWVRLAAGRGHVHEPLHAVLVTDGEPRRMLACDRKRLHMVEGAGGVSGLWHADTGEAVPGPYPKYDQAIPKAAASLELDVAAAWKTIQEAAEERQWLYIPLRPIRPGNVVVDPVYLADALVGAVAADGSVARVLLGSDTFDAGQVGPMLSPVRVDIPGTRRTAVVMPIREGGPEQRPCRDLGPFVKALSGAEEVSA